MRNSFLALLTLLLAACGPGINTVSTESTASPMSIPAPECVGTISFSNVATGSSLETVCGATIVAAAIEVQDNTSCNVLQTSSTFRVTTRGGFTRNAVVSGTLYDDWGNVIHAPVAPHGDLIEFGNNDLMDYEVGASRQMYLEIELANCDEANAPFSVRADYLPRSSNMEYLDNGNRVMPNAMVPNSAIVGDTFTFVASEATVTGFLERPGPSTFAPGTDMAFLDAFVFETTSEPLNTSTWSLIVEGASALSNITVEYYDSNMNWTAQTASIVDDTATFMASDLYLPNDATEFIPIIVVYGNLDPSATPGTTISASWTNNGLQAVGTDSGWAYGPSNVTSFVQGVQHTVSETSAR